MNALQQVGLTPASATTLIGTSALAALAVYNNARARAAERENPPIGQFIDVDGVSVHFMSRGAGRPIVLLHGNGLTSLDFLMSGLFQRAAEGRKVFAFDRPGFGYSDRPGWRIWSAMAQAQLLLRAFEKLNIERPVVLGHSWGASVALAMGLLAPERIDSLILVSGYYYPTSEYQAPLFMGPGLPVLGPLLSHTIAPPLARLAWGKYVRKAFAPLPVPESFWAFPREICVRPSQIQAEGAESGLMIPDAFAMQSEYPGLKTPVTIIAGDCDQIIDMKKQSVRLHAEIPHSRFIAVRGAGHMAHHAALNRIVNLLGAEAPPMRHAKPAEDLAPEPTMM